MTNLERMEVVMDAHAFVLDACDKIKSGGACDKCPICCVEDTSYWDLADTATRRDLIEFFGLAQDCDEYISDADYEADLADMERKAERDEWYD